MKNGRTYLFQIDPTWQRCKHRKDIQFGQTLVAGAAARRALVGTLARPTRAQEPLSSAKLVDYGILHSIGKIMGTRTHMYSKICMYDTIVWMLFRQKLSFVRVIQIVLQTAKNCIFYSFRNTYMFWYCFYFPVNIHIFMKTKIPTFQDHFFTILRY